MGKSNLEKDGTNNWNPLFFVCVCLKASSNALIPLISGFLCEGNICWFSHGDLKIKEGSSQKIHRPC